MDFLASVRPELLEGLPRELERLVEGGGLLLPGWLWVESLPVSGEVARVPERVTPRGRGGLLVGQAGPLVEKRVSPREWRPGRA